MGALVAGELLFVSKHETPRLCRVSLRAVRSGAFGLWPQAPVVKRCLHVLAAGHCAVEPSGRKEVLWRGPLLTSR